MKKMLAGRGLKPKPAVRKATKKTGKTWWDTATEKQKAERIRKMQAGRGLKPRAKKTAKGKSK